MKLLGKIILITGAAKRIGREIALQLAKGGASIVIHYRESKASALQLQQEIMKIGAQSYIVQADFSGRGPISPIIEKFLSQVYRFVPQIDVLVNNAAIFYPTPFGKIAEKDWDTFLNVNLKAPFFLAQAVGREMLKKKSGKIINLVDWMGDRPAARFLPYSISKAGLIAATKGLAKNLAPHVQVLGIAPGPILPAAHSSPQEQQQAAAKTLLYRFGEPKDIAETVRFLIEGTDFMTGSIVYTDGGASLA